MPCGRFRNPTRHAHRNRTKVTLGNMGSRLHPPRLAHFEGTGCTFELHRPSPVQQASEVRARLQSNREEIGCPLVVRNRVSPPGPPKHP
jgi:hypothetical protein